MLSEALRSSRSGAIATLRRMRCESSSVASPPSLQRPTLEGERSRAWPYGASTLNNPISPQKHQVQKHCIFLVQRQCLSCLDIPVEPATLPCKPHSQDEGINAVPSAASDRLEGTTAHSLSRWNCRGQFQTTVSRNADSASGEEAVSRSVPQLSHPGGVGRVGEETKCRLAEKTKPVTSTEVTGQGGRKEEAKQEKGHSR